jgi:hypothetical protein
MYNEEVTGLGISWQQLTNTKQQLLSLDMFFMHKPVKKFHDPKQWQRLSDDQTKNSYHTGGNKIELCLRSSQENQDGLFVGLHNAQRHISTTSLLVPNCQITVLENCDSKIEATIAVRIYNNDDIR